LPKIFHTTLIRLLHSSKCDLHVQLLSTPTCDECMIYLVLAYTSFVFDRVMVVKIWLVITICRYSRHDKRSKLPGWILSHLRDANLNLSTDMALHIAREVRPHSCNLKFL
jgi:hypothetical protein